MAASVSIAADDAGHHAGHANDLVEFLDGLLAFAGIHFHGGLAREQFTGTARNWFRSVHDGGVHCER